MIEYITGNIAELTPAYVVIDNGGIGYLLNTSLFTYEQLAGQTSARLLVHEVIREDAHLLYGFSSERERSLFRSLIGVSGVGANTARVILSSLSAPELESAIASGDHARLKKIKGIGAKTAERITVDLKDKIKPQGNTLIEQPQFTSAAYDEALAALLALGFARPQSAKVLKSIFDKDATVKVEAAIKKALSML
ncbi:MULTISPECIES: Holliday junction branch migration protein RuvA [Muribaculum]|jgi:Holliday junction DNA helicase RuvA|uniref:Holliday junction branch migration protein RuvA n=1 Tax=Muribaculum caecicola TaxID=3038144 RepID=A0AC61S3S3_9BACT|nr:MULTISPECIES: Holliday junction branch migration protein RuvA [Muribaculum]THG44897.1 Holliday junction branch migration protein RuvA [Muribaculum caecicola]